jgi:M6 family metalloprotease-like protein
MRNGWLRRWVVLCLVACFWGTGTSAVFCGEEIGSLLESLLGQNAPAEPDRYDDQLEFGSQIHFRALPGKLHRPTLKRAPHLPAAPGIRIVDPFGKIRKLVLLLRFKDHADRNLPDKDAYEAVFNGVGGHPEFATSGSAREYSLEVSYGKMEITTTIVGWIDLPETEQYYANGVEGDPERLAEGIKFALEHADRGRLVDFSDFDRNGDRYVDLFSIIHSGYGAEFPGADIDGTPPKDRIWSHQWRIPVWTSPSSRTRVSEYSCSTGLRGVEGTMPCRIGLLAHEVAHLGGLPDLYDGHEGQGIGAWGLLGYSEGFGNSGHTPSHFSPWAKFKLKWLQLKDLTESGTHRIKNIENYPDVYRIRDGFPDGEYLLIENRQPTGFDRELPGGIGGLAIWHIDENKRHNREPGYPDMPGWPDNNSHYMVALLQADGRFDLERGRNLGDSGDLFRGGAGGVNRVSAHEPHGLHPYRPDPNVERVLHRISEISEPGEEMTFRYDVESSHGNSSSDRQSVASGRTVESAATSDRSIGESAAGKENSQLKSPIHVRILPGHNYSPPVALPPESTAPGKLPLHPRGHYRKLVLLLRFKGHQNRNVPHREVFETMFNKPGGHPTLAERGSAFDYSGEVSYGHMTITSHIVDWIDLPKSEQYYSGEVSGVGKGNRIAEAVTYALDYIDRNSDIDLAEFDQNHDGYVDVFAVIHSGYGAETETSDALGVSYLNRVWSHQSNIPYWTSSRSNISVENYAMSTAFKGDRGSSPTGIGLIVHETAHLARLPDLYGGDNGGSGIGAWGLMGIHQGFRLDGHGPSHLDPWGKMKVGWVTPTDLTRSDVYRIRNIEDHPDVFRIKDGFPVGEYILIENRQPVRFHKYLPGNVGGLAIWHIDENKPDNNEPGYPGMLGWPQNDSHYKVALLQADGRFDLEKGQNYGDAGDLFRGGPGSVDHISSQDLNGLRPYQVDFRVRQLVHSISQISEPGEVMTFRYDVSPASSSDSTQQSLSVAAAGEEMTVPVAGAKIATAEYSHEDRKQLLNGGTLLQTRIELVNECIVHVRGDASVAPLAEAGVFSSGICSEESSGPSMWKDSVRIVSVRDARKYLMFGVNCRRRLPAGIHTIRWVVKSNENLQFPAGGSLVVQAYPCTAPLPVDGDRP